MATQKRGAASGGRYANQFPGGVPLHGGEGKLNWQWERIGQKLVGTFLGIKPYENGHIARMREAETGEVKAFSAPTILASILEGVENGSRIAIVFSEEQAPKKAGMNPTKLFEVYAFGESE